VETGCRRIRKANRDSQPATDPERAAGHPKSQTGVATKKRSPGGPPKKKNATSDNGKSNNNGGREGKNCCGGVGPGVDNGRRTGGNGLNGN